MAKQRSYTDEQLIAAVKNSVSIAGVIRSIGLSEAGGTYRSIKRRIQSLKLDNVHFTGKLWSKGKTGIDDSRIGKYDVDQIFSNKSKTSRWQVRKLILQHDLLKYECADCKNVGDWNNKKLNLHLDHINGKPNDHRLENLRWLCPNCHSQTPTYCKKNKHKPL